jgi:hypothetical protein
MEMNVSGRMNSGVSSGEKKRILEDMCRKAEVEELFALGEQSEQPEVPDGPGINEISR